MATFPLEEARRVAGLARLELDEAELARLAADLGAIAEAFGGLAEFAAVLPPVEAEGPGALRLDEVRPVDPATRAAILAAASHVASDGSVRAPRSL